MPGGEEEPAVAAGSPFSGPCAAADAGGPICGPWGAGNPVVPRAPVHIGIGGAPLRPPFLAAFGGPPFPCSTLDGVVAETRVVPWWGGASTVRAPAGKGESSAFQHGEGAPVAQGEGICCARQGEGAPAVHGGGETRPVCQQGGGGRCTRQGEEASACCARQGEGLPAVHGGGEARPVCPTGGRGPLHTAGRRGIRVLCPAGRGVARRARRRRGAPGLPNRGEGDRCTRQGEEVSACCARREVARRARRRRGAPGLPTGGRGTVAHGREKRHPRAVPGRERRCPPCTAEERCARFANRGEGGFAHGREKKYPCVHERKKGCPLCPAGRGVPITPGRERRVPAASDRGSGG